MALAQKIVSTYSVVLLFVFILNCHSFPQSQSQSSKSNSTRQTIPASRNPPVQIHAIPAHRVNSNNSSSTTGVHRIQQRSATAGGNRTSIPILPESSDEQTPSVDHTNQFHVFQRVDTNNGGVPVRGVPSRPIGARNVTKGDASVGSAGSAHDTHSFSSGGSVIN